MNPDLPKLYGELAGWFHLLTAPEDYAEEAGIYTQAILSSSDRPPETLLELGCGGGNNASHMKTSFMLTLTDISPQMLSLSQSLNPECEHILGDMRSLRLGRTFDAVFVHDAVCYLTSREDLRLMLETAWIHCRPGGVALFAPDFLRETFKPGTSHGGHDGEDRALRYLEWTWDPDPADDTYVSEMVYLLRDDKSTVRAVSDHHLLGLFSRSVWFDTMRAVGFVPTALPFVHSDVEPGTTEILIGKKSPETRES